MTKAGPLPLRSQPATDAPGQGGGAAPFPAEADEKERQRLEQWRRLIQACLPFADAASTELPLRRLLRLSLFQVSCGMAAVLLTGTLNRVMIVELGVPAWLVALMVSLPLVFAPLRALIGFKSDTHRSYFGWRRGPYIWFGSLMQFGGLAIMPFALLLLSGQGNGPAWLGHGRPAFHAALGLDPTAYDYKVFALCNEITKQVFPILLDIDHPGFRAGMEKLLRISDAMAAAKAEGGLLAPVKRFGLALAAGATFFGMYFLPVQQNEAPDTVRLAPAW